MNILLENYKGFDIFFDNDKDGLFFIHDVIGRVDGFRLSMMQEKIDSLFDSSFIPTVRGYSIDGNRYLDILGFDSKGNFIVKYEGGFKSNMVSSAGDGYFLEESRSVVEKIKSAEKEILDLRGKIKEYRSQIKTISSLIE